MHSTEALRDVGIFKGLADRSLAQLEQNSSVRRLNEGEFVVRVGETPRAFAVVASGQLKYFRVNAAGKEQVFAYAGSGHVTCISVVTDPQQASNLDCVARVPTELIEIETSAVRELARSDPQLALAMLAEQTKRLDRMVRLVDQLSLKDAHNRLALWLDQWVEENHPGAGRQELLVVLPYTQSEIAAQIGTVREVVSRGFSRMEKDGIIKATGKRVTLLDREGLQKMSSR